MASAGGRFFIEGKLKETAPHHASFKALWETKWQKPCSMGIYPFMFGSIQDFQPIVDSLIAQDIKEPYDWEVYCQTFFPKAEELVERAVEAEKKGSKDEASELYLRSSAVYRISRFPLERSPKQKYAWIKGKEMCLKGLSLREKPTREIFIPHTHANDKDGKHIPVYYALPPTASASNPVPLITVVTGLDGHRTELAVWIEGWLNVNCAVMVIEIPGTGDHPGDPSDPTSPDRVWDSVFDWIGEQKEIKQDWVVMWAFSTGGLYGIRVAHTHPHKLKGVVSLGGGCHYMFDERWLDEVNHLEYPFEELNALAYKFGYGDDVEMFKKQAMKFSLLHDGTLDKPGCARLLLVNGTEDEIFPIDDYYLALQHGDPKEARFVPGIKHMGEPESFVIIITWIYKLLGIKADVRKQLATLPFKAKY